MRSALKATDLSHEFLDCLKAELPGKRFWIAGTDNLKLASERVSWGEPIWQYTPRTVQDVARSMAWTILSAKSETSKTLLFGQLRGPEDAPDYSVMTDGEQGISARCLIAYNGREGELMLRFDIAYQWV